MCLPPQWAWRPYGWIRLDTWLMIVNIEVIQPKIYWNLYNNYFKGFELKLNNVILYIIRLLPETLYGVSSNYIASCHES